jgi:hypothetical protein
LKHFENFESKDGNSSTANINRLLIVNPYPIGANCPIGIMMENLLKNYETKEIMQCYTHPCEINKNIEYKAEQIILISPFLNFIKNIVRKIINRNKKTTMVRDQDKALRTIGVRKNNVKSWIDFLLPIYLNKKLINNIKEFNPTVIYTQGYSYTMLKYVKKLSEKLSCPVVVHTLDDWMETQYKKNIISAIPIKSFNNLFKSILNNGMNQMVASPKMANIMQQRYGGYYTFIMNCCTYPPYQKKERSKPFKIVYTGGLMLERYLILDKIAKIINDLNTSQLCFELHIYAPSSHINAYKDLMQPEIVFHNNVPHEDVYNVLIGSDILVHTESFNPNVVKFTRYSLSTKIPEYLASGRPLIYFGPTEIGVAEFLTENKIGICVENITDLQHQLLQLYGDKDYYETVAFDAYRKGENLLEENVMQTRLNSCLENR